MTDDYLHTPNINNNIKICSPNTRSILGLNISVLKANVAASLLEQLIVEKKPVRLAFVNANLANVAYEDKQLKHTLNQFLLLNDGVGINIASKLLFGESFPSNLNGTDFTPYFLDHCSTPLNIFLLGTHPSIVSDAASIFRRRWPQHNLIGFQDGYFTKEEDDQVIDYIKKSNPHIVLVAMGNGLQERWVERLVPEVALSAWGVGALFDFLTGEAHRAPLWLRRLNLEWTYRLIAEPKRMWKRYILGNPKFIMRVLHERIIKVKIS